MIRITSPEDIKGSGDFKLDGLLVKKHSFEKQTHGSGAESLVVEATPFARLDDGSIVAATDTVYKIAHNDLITAMGSGQYSAECVQAMMDAYFATEKATAMMMNESPQGVGCVWEAPQA